MLLKKMKQFLLFFTFIILVIRVSAQQEYITDDDKVLHQSIDLLKRYFFNDSNWFVTSPDRFKDVKSLVNMIENEPLDTIMENLNKTFGNEYNYVFRLPENVEDSLNLVDYVPYSEVQDNIEKTKRELLKQFTKSKIQLPASFLANLDEKLNLIPEGKGLQLFANSVYDLPDTLLIPDVIPDAILNSPEKYKRLLQTDSIRTIYVEQKRKDYNDSLIIAYTDSLHDAYIQEKYFEELNYQTKRIEDSVKVVNYNVLRAYNEQVINSVNDSIRLVLGTLLDYAGYIDSTNISIVNLSGDYSDIWLKNGDERFARVWLKNVQNDSLSVIIKSMNKQTMYMLIDDGVTFSRYKPKVSKDYDFSKLEKKISSLTNIGKGYEMLTPWVIGGDGNVGFTQTYIGEYWKKGGQSAISSLLVLKGFANYTSGNNKIKWNNNIEIRNGWIRFGDKGSEIQKNDDKLEFTTRLSLSAVKKWYYGMEMNYETQLFKGYRYPRNENPDPISAFMAPARTFFKIGMEYRKGNDFSLMLSPLTLKNVYVRDTVLIDQTKFGVEWNKKSFWEPGFNADIYIKYKINENIFLSSKYKMFFNYKQPFTKFDINWESQIDIPVSNYINVRFLLHLIYDDDVLFPVYDKNEVKVGEKPRLQVKEFVSVGFSYRINYKILKSKKLR